MRLGGVYALNRRRWRSLANDPKSGRTATAIHENTTVTGLSSDRHGSPNKTGMLNWLIDRHAFQRVRSTGEQIANR
jgi:hypothetical protein